MKRTAEEYVDKCTEFIALRNSDELLTDELLRKEDELINILIEGLDYKNYKNTTFIEINRTKRFILKNLLEEGVIQINL